jgi:hypothetical protein
MADRRPERGTPQQSHQLGMESWRKHACGAEFLSGVAMLVLVEAPQPRNSRNNPAGVWPRLFGGRIGRSPVKSVFQFSAGNAGSVRGG